MDLETKTKNTKADAAGLKEHSDIDQNVNSDQQVKNKLDYAKRNRTLEWRSRWLLTSRTRDEKELEKILEGGLKMKEGMIKRQRNKANHLAEYAEGPGPAVGGS